jgi:hypothetical protein
MTLKLTTEEFHELGLTIDPTDPSKAVPIALLNESLPDDSWDLDQLALYASTGLAEADRLDQESIQVGRRSTVQIYRSGRALSIARRRLKAEGRGRWGRWQEEHGFKRTTAWEAAELYERAGSEDEVAQMTPKDAKSRYGITKPTRRDLDDSADEPPSTATPPSAKPDKEVANSEASPVGQTMRKTPTHPGVSSDAHGGNDEPSVEPPTAQQKWALDEWAKDTGTAPDQIAWLWLTGLFEFGDQGVSLNEDPDDILDDLLERLAPYFKRLGVPFEQVAKGLGVILEPLR